MGWIKKMGPIKFARRTTRSEWDEDYDEKPMVVELLFRSDDDNVDVDDNDVDVSPEETKKVFTDDGRLAATWDNAQMYRQR